jgi:1-phosphofructokinase
VVNAVGAGDATLAGFIAGGPDRYNSLQTAVLWGSSAVAHGTTLFEVIEELNHRVTILESFDRDQNLGEKIIKEAAL